MAKQKGLGRGLDALLSGDEASVSASDRLTTLPVNQLQSGKYQPRSQMDEASLETLATSIKNQGVMQPILVRALAVDQYEIIAGERRWRASQLAGLDDVPVIVREIGDESTLAMALIENIQREDLSPIEEALGIKRLIDEFNMTHEKAAHAVGRSRAAVSNLLRLLTLADGVQWMLMTNKLEMGHARALVGLDAAKQVMLANQIMQEGLSVREVEALVKKKIAPAEKAKSNHAATQDTLRLQEKLSDQLGASVTITTKPNGAGTLKINYSTLDQLDDLIDKISG